MSLLRWSNYLFNISWIFVNYSFLFHKFFSNFVSYKFTCCFSCFMDYLFWKQILVHLVLFLSNNCFSYFLDIFLSMTKTHIPCHVFLFLVIENNEALLSPKKVSFLFINKQCQITLSSIYNGLPLFSSKAMIISPIPVL